MAHLRIILILIAGIVNLTTISGQSNQRFISVKNSTLKFALKDSLFIFPMSIEITSMPSGFLLEKSGYCYQNDSVIIQSKADLTNDSLYWIRYRVLDNKSFKPLKLLDTSQISDQKFNPFLAYQFSEEKKTENVGFGNLNYRGSISRSILAGNNQDLSLNSNLNLQFSGKIDPETEIAAVITDNNIPIQPDGATRQIQEFDKIYIQVKRKNTSLLAGDYEISSPQGYFMKYYKKLRGATLSNQIKIGNKNDLNSRASFAISRGKFSRMIINGIEGNQGPYKMLGAEGESFIIVLSGTEKVFLDGMVMQRGLQDDYTIDYNRGDFSFTSKRMITKDSRIIIEFEYVVQNYVRSILTLSESLKIKKTIIGVQIYSEQDGKNSQGNLELSPSEKIALSKAGDNPNLAIVQSLDTTSTDPIKYRVADTLGYKNVLIYAENDLNAKYSASFAFVGNGNGDYILDTEKGVNGRIFKWIQPENGISKGNYSAIKRLIAPTIQQMATINVQTTLTKNMNLSGEIGISRFDKNRFSNLDSRDDGGFAGKITLNRTDSLGKKWLAKTILETEYLSDYFKPVNPFRNSEFNRDYNYKTQPTNELWINSGLSFSKGSEIHVKYLYNIFRQGNLFDAGKHDVSAVVSKNGWNSSLIASFLTSKSETEATNFIRPKYELSKTFTKNKDLTAKIFVEAESNKRRNIGADTLFASGFRFLTSGASIAYQPQNNLNSIFTATHRIDETPSGNDFTRQTEADQISIENNFKIKKNQSVQIIAQYRNLRVSKPNISFKSGDNYLGRVQHNYANPSGILNNSLSYEIGSGQEQKIDYFYQEVNSGIGQYEYNDYNADGIKQLDEFEIATNIDKAKFIRLIVLSNEFVQTDNISINENIALGFPDKWETGNTFKKALQKVTLNSSFQLNRKLKGADVKQVINPFTEYDEALQLAQLNYFYNSVLQINRGKPGFEIQLGLSGNANRQLLTSGLEGRSTLEYFQFTRLNLNPVWQLENRVAYLTNTSEAELFISRNFILNIFKMEPALIVNSSLNTRFSMKSKWETGGTKVEENGITIDSKQVSAEMRHNTNNRSSLNVKFTFTDIKFTGNQSSPAGFSLLQGLNNGKNFQFNLDLDYRITKKLYLVAGYEGRKLGSSKLIHVFRTQLKAEF